jgi:transposase
MYWVAPSELTLGGVIMESNPINSQNQRVERISTTTLVIGIDIAKEKHAAQAINF